MWHGWQEGGDWKLATLLGGSRLGHFIHTSIVCQRASGHLSENLLAPLKVILTLSHPVPATLSISNYIDRSSYLGASSPFAFTLLQYNTSSCKTRPNFWNKLHISKQVQYIKDILKNLENPSVFMDLISSESALLHVLFLVDTLKLRKRDDQEK